MESFDAELLLVPSAARRGATLLQLLGGLLLLLFVQVAVGSVEGERRSCLSWWLDSHSRTRTDKKVVLRPPSCCSFLPPLSPHLPPPPMATLLPCRTSAALAHSPISQPQPPPLKIFSIRLPDSSAAIGISECPGKRDRDLTADLDAIAASGASLVLTLIEKSEMERLGVAGIGEAVFERGMRWRHLPIRDFNAPGSLFETAWVNGGGHEARAVLRKGGRVHVHCRGGIGRAGTISARLLVELGIFTPEDAIDMVRSARPGAIETLDQERHVRQCRAVVDERHHDRGAMRERDN